MLTKCSVEKYDTCTFEAGGYTWKQSLYPNGNKKKTVKEHLSLYLVLADTSSLPPGWNVNVVFRFFLFDQRQDKYLTLEDAKASGTRFHGMKTEWGFDEFISFKSFNDPSNGYLIDDECVLGAEVFVIKERCCGYVEKIRGENLGGWLVVEGWIKPSLFDGIPNGKMLDGTKVQFKSVALQKYIAAENGGGSSLSVNSSSASDWETFRIWRVSESAFQLRTNGGQYLSCDGGREFCLYHVILYKCLVPALGTTNSFYQV